MNRYQKIAVFHSFVAMLLSPAYVLYHGLRSNFSYDTKRWLLICFITIYGSIITISEGNDGYDHRQNVYVHYTELSFTQFIQESGDILTFKDNLAISEDLYIHVLSYLVGSVLHLPALFFVFVSFVYAYFFAGSIFLLLRFHKIKKYHWLFYGFLTVFILLKNIEGINTVRTWTGLWILFYACLRYYQTKKKKFLILMFVSPFVHVGYFLMALPAWFVLVAGNRPKIYTIIFALSFFVNIPNTDVLFKQLNETEVGAEKVDAYKVMPEQKTNETFSSQVVESNAWYAQLQEIGLQAWVLKFLAGVLILFDAYPKKMDPLELNLFSIGILTVAFSNLTWMLYAVSSRSGMIAMVFIMAAFILMWRRDYFDHAYFQRKRTLRVLLKISFLLLVPFIIYKVADLIYYISIYMLAFPFVPWFTDGLNYSIREFIGLLL